MTINSETEAIIQRMIKKSVRIPQETDADIQLFNQTAKELGLNDDQRKTVVDKVDHDLKKRIEKETQRIMSEFVLGYYGDGLYTPEQAENALYLAQSEMINFANKLLATRQSNVIKRMHNYSEKIKICSDAGNISASNKQTENADRNSKIFNEYIKLINADKKKGDIEDHLRKKHDLTKRQIQNIIKEQNKITEKKQEIN